MKHILSSWSITRCHTMISVTKSSIRMHRERLTLLPKYEGAHTVTPTHKANSMTDTSVFRRLGRLTLDGGVSEGEPRFPEANFSVADGVTFVGFIETEGVSGGESVSAGSRSTSVASLKLRCSSLAFCCIRNHTAVEMQSKISDSNLSVPNIWTFFNAG